MTFSDEILQAYLDGTLDGETCKALEAAVEADPALEHRLITLDPFGPALKEIFEPLPGEDRLGPLADPPKIETGQASPKYRPLALVAALAGLAAFGLTFWLTRPDALNWREQVAIYQALYSPETISQLDTAPDVLDAQFARAEAKLGRSLQREKLAELPGLELKRAQILSLGGTPLVQIVFADPEGLPIAFCILQGDALPGEKGVTRETLSGLATAHWGDGEYGYMLVGGNSDADLEQNLGALTGLFQS